MGISVESTEWFFSPLFPGRIRIWKCWFLWREENRSTRRKLKSSEQDENQQQTQPTYDAEIGNWTRAKLVGGECSHHCAIPAPCNRELKQRRRQRQRKRISIYLYFICATSRLFQHAQLLQNGELSRNQIDRSGVLVKKDNEKFTAVRSRSPQNLKCGHFTFFFCRGRQRNVPKCKTHLQSDCFCSLNLLFCGVVVSVAVVVA